MQVSVFIFFIFSYASFITDLNPRSIYEVDGAENVLIELIVFPKQLGLLELGWHGQLSLKHA